MTKRGLVVRIGLLALLVIILFVALLLRAAPRGEALAYTTCGPSGAELTMDVPRIAPEDLAPVRMHEEVHRQQCADLGWIRMRLRNLTAGGRLSLEAPGYCAGARVRLRRGDNYAVTRERMIDDANAMFAGQLDAARVNAALRVSCPDLAASVMQ